MLPRGLTADLASFSDQQTLKAVHPDAQTVARILAGRCSCDLIRPRLDDPQEDERHLRERYRRLKTPRPVVIAALERHRRPSGLRVPAEWGPRLASFVAEHARNAGPTLYYLHFCPDHPSLSSPGDLRRVTSSMVTATPGGWVQEASPTLVTR